jgi:hypothetical protein
MRIMTSIAACAALLFAPLTASAVQNAAKTITYHTAYTQTNPLPSGGEVTGRMRLTFSPGGIVSGTYREEYGARISTVTGGVNGNKIWLSFGIRGRHQFSGVIAADGTISGTLSNWHGPRQYRFTAVPSTP